MANEIWIDRPHKGSIIFLLIVTKSRRNGRLSFVKWGESMTTLKNSKHRNYLDVSMLSTSFWRISILHRGMMKLNWRLISSTMGDYPTNLHGNKWNLVVIFIFTGCRISRSKMLLFVGKLYHLLCFRII